MNTEDSFTKELVKYLIGFGLCICLTATSFLIVLSGGLGSLEATMAFIGVLAIAQFFVQLRYFLHFKFERSPFSRAGGLWMTLGTMLVIVLGSLWIMRNLDYRMGMSPEAMKTYMEKQNQKGF